MIISAIFVPLIFGRFLNGMSMGQLLVVSQLIYLIPVLIYMAVMRARPGKWMPFQKIPVPAVLMLILFSVLLLPLVIFINLISMLFVENAVAGMNTGLQANSFLLNLLLLAIMPAVSEEFMFRGILYHGYRERGVLMGALACGIAFGLLHLNFNQFSYALVLGMVLCLVLEATGSIFGSMAVHFVINGWNVVLMEIQKNLSGLTASAQVQGTELAVSSTELLVALAVYGLFALVGTALAACTLVWIAKRCGRLEHMKWCFTPRRRQEGEKKTFITPCWIVGTGICLFYMLIAELG